MAVTWVTLVTFVLYKVKYKVCPYFDWYYINIMITNVPNSLKEKNIWVIIFNPRVAEFLFIPFCMFLSFFFLKCILDDIF